MKLKTMLFPLAAIAAAGFAFAPAAQASTAVHDSFMVEQAAYVNVTMPTAHGYLTHFAVGYTDGYVHEDPIPAASHVREIDSYTGQAPDVQGWDGCLASSRHQHQPDQLFATDSAQSESAGLGGGTTKATGLHHNQTITVTPIGSGPFFLWCHYEHGPETFVTLTFSDGSTVHLMWCPASYFRELYISYGGTIVSATAVGADD